VQWVMRCTRCRFRASTLVAGSSNEDADGVAEREVDTALGRIREANFETVVTRLKELGAGTRLLDVGCYRGTMLRVAARHGFEPAGIEPDEVSAEAARAGGAEVVHGFFPHALPPGRRFDVITFNDVFEHLPDVNGAMAAIEEHLVPGGLLAINLPNSRSALYRCATQLARLRLTQPLERLWQKNLRSPHLTYFTPDVLAALAARHRFTEVHREDLSALRLTGLWSRLRLDKRETVAVSAAQYAGLIALYPCLRLFPSDSGLQIFRSAGG